MFPTLKHGESLLLKSRKYFKDKGFTGRNLKKHVISDFHVFILSRK